MRNKWEQVLEAKNWSDAEHILTGIASLMLMAPSSLRSRLGHLLLFAATLSTPMSAAEAGAERVRRRAEAKVGEVVNFSLLDYQGKCHELRRSEARAVVLFFTSFGCLIARQNGPELRAMSRQVRRSGVDTWLFNSSTQEDPDDATIEMFMGFMTVADLPPGTDASRQGPEEKGAGL